MLNTNRFLLRSFTDDDLENVFAGLSHPDVIKYYGVSYQTLEAAKQQITWYKTLESEGTGKWWAVCSPDNKIFYGACGVNNVQPTHRKAEIGFWLLPEFWGKGIILEVLPMICDCGFSELGLHRIEAFVESENLGSIAIMKKLGFKREGTLRDSELKNDKWIQLHIYSKLKTDEKF